MSKAKALNKVKIKKRLQSENATNNNNTKAPTVFPEDIRAGEVPVEFELMQRILANNADGVDQGSDGEVEEMLDAPPTEVHAKHAKSSSRKPGRKQIQRVVWCLGSLCKNSVGLGI